MYRKAIQKENLISDNFLYVDLLQNILIQCNEDIRKIEKKIEREKERKKEDLLLIILFIFLF